MTCAYDAAGKKVRASNTAIAIFFTIDDFLQGFEFRTLNFRIRISSGLLIRINATRGE
jgi:hypothetical protein